jgi:two-component system response regulator PilR (NtrC family)/two-component system response regulator HydG
MTAFGSIDAAVDAMRAGAFHYVTKPFKNDEVLVVLERAFEHRMLQAENRRLRLAVDKTSSMGELLGESPAMREIFALIRKLSDSRSNVLITGESGTGKEVVSRTLHFSSSRADAPFIPINCTAIPEGLLESELFGHVRGAFTGADTSREGLFAKAEGGTLFLDEIGDMGGSLQGKLLRVLQDGEIRPVGSNESIHIDVRVIAATNKDLREEIDAGRFRRDLFYRLNVIPIHIPPLRERPEDIAPLTKAFVAKHAGERAPMLSAAALERLRECRWEGNARELENTIERSLALTDGDEIGVGDLMLAESEAVGRPDRATLADAFEARMSLRELEDLYTARVLKETGGNKMQAARILGIDRRTLYRRDDRKARATNAASQGNAEA